LKISTKKDEENDLFYENVKFLAYIGEKYYHGNPSGLDNITSLFGGLILFKNLKKFESISTKILLENFLKSKEIYIIDTLDRRETHSFVKKVADFKKDFPEIFENTINSIKYISESMIKILEDENSCYEKFSCLVNLNNKFLEILPVSNLKIEEIIWELKKNNIPCKITGAGGGGFVLCFIEKKKITELDIKVKILIYCL
jgi:mevalonate kinase